MYRFENHKKPLAKRRVFIKRLIRFAIFGALFIFISLWLGAFGYKYFLGISWVDAFYNASMILTGMGPVATLTTDNAKIFATLYSIYSGVAFLTSVGVIFAPLIHRLFHSMYLDIDQNEQ